MGTLLSLKGSALFLNVRPSFPPPPYCSQKNWGFQFFHLQLHHLKLLLKTTPQGLVSLSPGLC